MKKLQLLSILTILCSCKETKYVEEKISYKYDAFTKSGVIDTTYEVFEYENEFKAYSHLRKDYLLDSLSYFLAKETEFPNDSMIKQNIYEVIGDDQKILPTNKPEFVELEETAQKESLLISKRMDKSHYSYLRMTPEERDLAEMANLTKDAYEKNLSNWDGSLPALVGLVKESLHNPDSFDHVETGYSIKESYVQVRMIYRAENGYGAIRKGSIIVKTDANANITSIIENSQ